jgi:hypothetical protein
MPIKKKAPKKKRGPEAFRLKIEGDWTEAVKRTMRAGLAAVPKKKRRKRRTLFRA